MQAPATGTEIDIEDAKAGLRAEARARRAAIAPILKETAPAVAMRAFLDGVPLSPGDIVAGYWPIGDELDCKPLLAHLLDAGQPVCLPIVRGEGLPLDMRLWQEGAPLYPSGFGTLAPAETAPLVEPDVVIAPLLAFDAVGTRLGYGGGYYDRTLARLAKRPRLIGYAYGAQELAHIPRAPHDRPLDAVVTESGLRRFTNAAAAA